MWRRVPWRDHAASLLEWTLFIVIAGGIGFPLGMMLHKLLGVRIKVGVVIGVVVGVAACYFLSGVTNKMRQPR
jgi:hypothetical protein